MAKKKIIKVLIGEAYDKESKKNFPVYATFWPKEDGSYSRTEKAFVSEVEVSEKKSFNKQPVGL